MITFGVCAAISLRMYILTYHRAWFLLMLFNGTCFLGDTYWVLYLFTVGHTPKYFYVADLCWYAAFTFLYLLLYSLASEEEAHEKTVGEWAGPAFTAGMCAFYISITGDYFQEILLALTMGLLLHRAIRSLIYIKRNPTAKNIHRRLILTAVSFCLLEYAMQTVSCFWMGDTIRNPYFWLDLMVTASAALLVPTTRKARRVIKEIRVIRVKKAKKVTRAIREQPWKFQLRWV